MPTRGSETDNGGLRITFRAAKPTLDEGMAYARCLDELSPGFRKVLGDASVDIVATAYAQPGHDLSYEHVTYAEHDGAIVGVLSCYTAHQHRVSNGGALRQALKVRGPRRLGAASLAFFLRHFGPETANEYYVWVLFVNEQFRSQGIGSALMDTAEYRAREDGLTRLALDVEAKNDRARILYERQGMTVESGWPSLPFIPAGAYRMTKSL